MKISRFSLQRLPGAVPGRFERDVPSTAQAEAQWRLGSDRPELRPQCLARFRAARVPLRKLSKDIAERASSHEGARIHGRVARDEVAGAQPVRSSGVAMSSTAHTAISVFTKSCTRSSGGGAGARPAGWNPGGTTFTSESLSLVPATPSNIKRGCQRLTPCTGRPAASHA